MYGVLVSPFGVWKHFVREHRHQSFGKPSISPV
jgi:hypothetical protein